MYGYHPYAAREGSMTMAQSKEARVERLELRVSARQANVIRQAAGATSKTVTAFVLDAAYVEAQRALADRRMFRLDAERWERFVAALDRPVVEKPRLRRLLREPGIVE
jgi:uncharacterized protein (DUF1778 family)